MAPVLKAKARKVTSVQVNYLVHIQEIRPWPPSESLRSLHFIVLQWEYGDWSSGSTNPVVPSLGSGVRDGKIEFNEYFRLPITLSRNVSHNGEDVHTFQKNRLEFSLYEPRRDNTVKGQLLGTAIIDLAEYGVLKETLKMSVPMNCNRNFRNSSQPVLFLKVQPLEKHGSNTSTRENMSKETSLVKDVSSHSTLTFSPSVPKATRESPPHNDHSKSEAVRESTGRVNRVSNLPLEPESAKPEVKLVTAELKLPGWNLSHSSSFNSSSMIQSLENGHASLANFSKGSSTSIPNESVIERLQYVSSVTYEGEEHDKLSNISMKSFDTIELARVLHEKKVNGAKKIKENARRRVKEYKSDGAAPKITSLDTDLQLGEKSEPVAFANSHDKGANGETGWGHRRNEPEEAGSNISMCAGLMVEEGREKHAGIDQEVVKKKENSHCTHVRPVHLVSTDVIRKPVSSLSSTLISSDRLKHVDSVQQPLDSTGSSGSITDIPFMKDIKEIKDACPRNMRTDRKDAVTVLHGVAKNNSFDSRVQQLGHKIEKLEEELKEVAAIEIAIYSVVAEHRCSPKNFLAPARRLSRFYLHAYRQGPLSRMASVARTAVSGLVVVVKACGKDVPRLTFWLSNSVALRVIVSQAIENWQPPVSDASSHVQTNGSGEGNAKRSSLSKWSKSSPSKKEKKFGFTDKLDELRNPETFVIALEKIEAWIFSRIIESVWQTLAPYMQSASPKENKQNISSSLKKIVETNHSMRGQGQASFSLDLWKKALRDVYERLCPVRAGGHECACFSLLNRLIMEQCVDRLDVAMFNAFLCESADEAPADPASNPIGNSKVLPVPSGKSSFSNGAQLKNAILNWSKWLDNLFGIDEDDSHKYTNDHDDDKEGEHTASFQSFHMLNALSDLMMLPKDMLMNRSIRKEVCPAFSASIIKRILKNFVPDELSPEPIPEGLFDALDSKVSLEDKELVIRKFPCKAMPIAYFPPSPASLSGIIEIERESQAKRSDPDPSLRHLQQSYVSDDDLEELSSSMTSIVNGQCSTLAPKRKQKETRSNNAIRYQLLQEASTPFVFPFDCHA